MRIISLLAILAFPVAEIWILINLAHQYGWWLILYLVVMAMLGLQLIRDIIFWSYDGEFKPRGQSHKSNIR